MFVRRLGKWAFIAAIFVAVSAIASSAKAGWWNDCCCQSPWARFERAGNPQCVAPWARCSFTRNSDGYYVGGGTPSGLGRCRCPDEGTWGWDYDPARWFAPRVALNWTRRERYQGGTGSYEPDTPRIAHGRRWRNSE